VLGADAVGVFDNKLRSMARDLDAWRDVSTATSFEN
jgi:hypothetical protein